jgi:phosphatidylethanolamine/phosphatidyl-N-methylethanolamine N-methyltransferase
MHDAACIVSREFRQGVHRRDKTRMATIARRAEILRSEAIQTAYARLARYYDVLFGPLLAPARLKAVHAVNALPGAEVLEVGVGTGLALQSYAGAKRVTGIDMSSDMLLKAKERAFRRRLANVQALYVMDAQAMNFQDGRFDIAVAMFVASAVPDPHALIAEMRRVFRPGGMLLFVNHFTRENGGPAWWRQGSGALTAKLGWRADFRPEDIFDPVDLTHASFVPLWPFGFFQLVKLVKLSSEEF